MLLAVALSCKEGTADYEWQYNMYLQVVGILPSLILTEADLGATAAIRSVFPNSLHLWCMWHIHQNLRGNLGSKLGNEYSNFVSDFIKCQQMTSEEVFKHEYDKLKHMWKEAAPYLDKQLTPDINYWAGYRWTRFSAGAVSTQRGEGLNRHFKVHLSLQSPLCKLFEEVLLREEREATRLFVSGVRDEMHATNSRSYALSVYPTIIQVWN